ncbi:MAG: hypothetical protein FWB80_12760, partial [Defluviitaleaceae bacterium]|nr:hypothetical protein [Defluviitaleaceae bacterium]
MDGQAIKSVLKFCMASEQKFILGGVKMKTHNISLESITPDGLTKFGTMKKSSMKVKVENGELH